MTLKTKTKKEHYVNNKEFLAAMIEYKKSIKSRRCDVKPLVINAAKTWNKKLFSFG